MYGFLIKKSFCDDWDNLLLVVVFNVLFMFVGLLLALLASYVAKIFPEGKFVTVQSIVLVLLFLLLIIAFCVLSLAFGELSAKIADFEGVHIGDFFKAIPGVLKDATLYGLLWGAIILLSINCFSFYFTQSKSMFGFFTGCVLFWIDICLLLALQWFVPIRSIMHNNFKKCLKKCLIIFFDNTGFSILVFIHSILLIPFTIALIGFFPSIGGIIINRTNALRIRLYKYDYLEAHPELTTRADRKNIPWEELIYDDRETLGPRKLRSFLFPWKEEK